MPELQPWQAGFGLWRPCRAALQDEGPWCPPGPTSLAQPPAQLRRSSPPTPHTLRTDASQCKSPTPRAPFLRRHLSGVPLPGLTFCDAVHHRAKHQDVRAAVCAASQAAVTAQACRTERRRHMDTLVTTSQTQSTSWLSLRILFGWVWNRSVTYFEARILCQSRRRGCPAHRDRTRILVGTLRLL